jgi:hypothetical protein
MPVKFEGRHGARAGPPYFLVSITTARSAQSAKRACFALYSALGCKMIHVGRNA